MSPRPRLPQQTAHCQTRISPFIFWLPWSSTAVGGLVQTADYRATGTAAEGGPMLCRGFTIRPCSCGSETRRSRCRWGGTAGLAAPVSRPELPPRTRRRDALTGRERGTWFIRGTECNTSLELRARGPDCLPRHLAPPLTSSVTWSN